MTYKIGEIAIYSRDAARFKIVTVFDKFKARNRLLCIYSPLAILKNKFSTPFKHV